MRKYKNIIIDSSNLFWRHFSALNKGQDESPAVFANTIKQSLNGIKKIVADYGYENSKVYLLFDNPDSKVNERKIISDGRYKYKRHKKAVTGKFYKALNVFKKLIKHYSDNFYILESMSLEADDLTYPLKKYLKESYSKLSLFVSSDMDWARNMSKFADWYNFKTLYTNEQFFKKYEFRPSASSIKMFKTIRGDASDSIDVGVPYLPKEILLDIVTRYKNVEQLLHNLPETKIPDNWKKKIRENEKQLKLNYQLVDFFEMNESIEDIIFSCRRDIKQLCVWYKVMNIPFENWMIDKGDKATDFFSRRINYKIK